MRRAVLCLAAIALPACGQRAAKLSTPEDSISYVFGYQIGGNLKQQNAPANPDAILRGLKDALAGTRPVLSDSQARVTMMAYQQKMMASQQSARESAGSANTAEAEKFFADNAKQPGVKTTASGLQWKVIKEGKGPRPKATSTVSVHYRGTLLNGKEFDKNGPVTFALNQVIPGWSEAVQLMNAGAKYQFWIPAKLAYGENGSPPAIGPHSALMFEIELVSFK